MISIRISNFLNEDFLFSIYFSKILIIIFSRNMSSIEGIEISGIRSYSPSSKIDINFVKPLTLIWGHNGSGKTVSYVY